MATQRYSVTQHPIENLGIQNARGGEKKWRSGTNF
jgi:hypothetical protein